MFIFLRHVYVVGQ